MNREEIAEAVGRYRRKHGLEGGRIRAALIDMDGVLYDSMPYHTLAWHRMMSELGVECDRDEFYLYEGMTGRATIRLLFRRAFNRDVSDEECARLYAVKTRYFNEFGQRKPMPGASEMLGVLRDHGIDRVLVTGSGQKSLIDTLRTDYPDMFADDRQVTAADVTHGKPHPEPYLMGLRKAGVKPEEAIVVENAPLGVEAGHTAGCFVCAVTTGPIPREKMLDAGADLVFDSMREFAEWLPTLITVYSSGQ